MKRNLSKVIYGCVFVLSFVFSCFGQNNSPKTEDPTLEFGQTIEREIAGGGRHDYKLKLSQGQFVRVEAEQINCDLIFALYSYTADENFFDVNNSSPNGIESATAAVSKDGEYNLQVVSMSSKNGSYKLKIAELRPAAPKELNLTAGIVLSNLAFLKVTSSSTTDSILKGIDDNEAALDKFRLAGDKSFESRTLNNIGSIYNKLGNGKKALEYYQQALQISTAIGDKYEISLNLSNLGAVYQAQGEWQSAFDALLKSLELRREIKHVRGEVMSLNRIGCFLRLLGENTRALEYFQQSLDIIKNNNLSRNYEADALENIGAIYLSSGEFEKAQATFQKALEISKITTSRRREATYLNYLGKVYFLLGDNEKSLRHLDESFKIGVELNDKILKAEVLKNLGQVQSMVGDTDKSLVSFNQSLEIFRVINDRQNLAETLLNTARAESKKGNLEAAQSKAEEAIDFIESIRTRVPTTDFRNSFSVNLQDYYEFYVELLMMRQRLTPGKGFDVLAFQASERARARGLLNLLNESNADISRGVDPKLLAKESELKNLLAARLENLTKVLSGKAEEEKTVKLKNEIEQIRCEYEQTEAQIRTTSPHYAALTQPKPLTLAEIQKEVLDADSVLLEYALGETKSFLWVVTKNSFETIELPAREKIERTARQVYETLTARNKRVKFETTDERQERIEGTDAEFAVHSKNLSQMILAPAARAFDNKRLLIVADGALQYVPFASLLRDEKYLIETNEIVNLPSASVLSVLRKEMKSREIPTKTLAVFADPIFDKNDERLVEAVNKNKSKPVFQTVAARNSTRGEAGFFGTREGLELGRLPFTRREASLVSAQVPAGRQLKRLDFEANRQLALSPELSAYRYVHFATHGFIDNQMPEQSGIVLSLFDENGAPQDGFLRVGDIYNLRLNAEMVVLSGCRTGLGREIRGEGLVGLTRGFMYAGARRVTVSLWDVNDEATAELMGRFYGEMLGQKKLQPVAALRQAQIMMIKNKRWQNPYFWAPFVLQGEPK